MPVYALQSFSSSPSNYDGLPTWTPPGIDKLQTVPRSLPSMTALLASIDPSHRHSHNAVLDAPSNAADQITVTSHRLEHDMSAQPLVAPAHGIAVARTTPPPPPPMSSFVAQSGSRAGSVSPSKQYRVEKTPKRGTAKQRGAFPSPKQGRRLDPPSPSAAGPARQDAETKPPSALRHRESRQAEHFRNLAIDNELERQNWNDGVAMTENNRKIQQNTYGPGCALRFTIPSMQDEILKRLKCIPFLEDEITDLRDIIALLKHQIAVLKDCNTFLGHENSFLRAKLIE